MHVTNVIPFHFNFDFRNIKNDFKEILDMLNNGGVKKAHASHYYCLFTVSLRKSESLKLIFVQTLLFYSVTMRNFWSNLKYTFYLTIKKLKIKHNSINTFSTHTIKHKNRFALKLIAINY